MKSVLVIAAESSAAQYASEVIAQMQSQGFEGRFYGIGDQAMIESGFHAVARAEELAVVGISEVLANYRKIRGAFFDVLKLVEEDPPALALLIDYPGFNLKLSKELHQRGVKVVYYVSPQLWAWKKGRIKTVQKYVDHMLVLFPFEEAFYKDHGVKVDLVGHPMLDEADLSLVAPEQRNMSRSRFGLQPHDFLLGLMPGSRKRELAMHLPTQIEVARRLFKKHNQMRFAFLVAPTLQKEDLLDYFEDVRFPYILIKDEPFKMIALTDVILAASGTATLQVALMNRPMVIMYRMAALTAWIAKMIVTAKFFGLVNVILEREAVFERFQEKANPTELGNLVESLKNDEDLRNRQLESFAELRGKLLGGASQRVAKILMGYLQ